jgi:hypothetical protein
MANKEFRAVKQRQIPAAFSYNSTKVLYILLTIDQLFHFQLHHHFCHCVSPWSPGAFLPPRTAVFTTPPTKPHHCTLPRLATRYTQHRFTIVLPTTPQTKMPSLITIPIVLALATLTTTLPIPGAAIHPRPLFSKRTALDSAGWLLICYDFLAAGLLVALWSWNRLHGRIVEMRREQEQEQEGLEMQEFGPRDGNSSMEVERASTVERTTSVESAMRRLGLI